MGEAALTNSTTIVRTGGATDGATPISWQILTTTISRWLQPFESFTVAEWNAVTGAECHGDVAGDRQHGGAAEQ